MKNEWVNYYKNRVGNGYTDYASKRYAPFINTIKSFKAKTIVEEGCGIGTISKILGSNVESFDVNGGMVGLCSLNGVYARTKSIITNFTADLICSHGVLEHLSDFVIHSIIKRPGVHVHYVPSNKYENASFGDERLMSAETWKAKFMPTNIFEFNGGKDLTLVWS